MEHTPHEFTDDAPLPAPADRLASLSPAKRAALESMLLARRAAAAEAQRIRPRPACDKTELSFAEQRLWLLDQVEPSHPFYNMPLAAQIDGPLDLDRLTRALRLLADRHETLRYSYHKNEGDPVRTAADEVFVVPEVIDYAGKPADANALEERLRAEARKPFDLSKPPLLRCVVFRLSADRHVVLLVMHHIVSDGWSMWVLLSDLAALYDSHDGHANGHANGSGGNGKAIAPLAVQYSDYAVWQRERLTGELAEKQTRYWQERLASTPPAVDLPTDRPRSPTPDYEGALHTFTLPAALGKQLTEAAAATGATPFVLLMAAYQVWLARHTGQTDVCVGSVTAGRRREELERLVGFFVNTHALRSDLADDPTFAQHARHVQREAIGMLENQDLPFEQVLQAVAPERDRSHEALFQTALVVQNPPRDFAASRGLRVTPVPVDNGTAKYDLTFFFWQEGPAWVGQIEYRTSLFDRATIERFAGAFQTLLSDALASPHTRCSRLRLLNEQQQAALARFNDTSRPVTPPHLIHEQVLLWAERKPTDAAVRFGGRTITYGGLEATTRRVAAGLQAAGVRVGEPVLVCLPRSAESVIAMLAVWRAGGVYVPVDPETTGERGVFVLADCGAKVCVTGRGIEPPTGEGVTQLHFGGLAEHAGELAPPSISPADRCYIIYTSGSSGLAKGVEVEHASIVNFVQAQTSVMEVTSKDRVLHGLSPAFDGGLAEVLLGVGNGATLVIADRTTTLDPPRFTELLRTERVNIAKFTPAVLATLNPDDLPGLEAVLSAGDLLTGDLARRWQPGRRFFNGYGPTEVTVGVSIHRLPGPPDGPPPVGPPMPNMRAYVLDPHGQPVPIGVTGEIYIGGAGVARGYVNRPDETAARFVPDPFVEASGQATGAPPRMYRTGDLGRWRPSGVLEFVGRVDDQVQVRGYRVEPAEVTSALESLPEVDRAFTLADQAESGENRLVAYLVPSREAADDALARQQEHLRSWQSLMEQTHRATGALRDPQFDITGWVSTFTGQPIPKEQMQRWAGSTINRILALRPKNVLEIGVGGGLLLLGVAPGCESYVGADFLACSLDQLRRVVEQKQVEQGAGGWASRVELHQQAAHEVGPLAGRRFDTIVLNSVVQYFPSLDYLRQVLQAAAGLLAPGGQVFLGDLRNLHLQEAMAAAVERRRSRPDSPARELLGRVESRLRHEEELLLAPQLLHALAADLPRLSSVRIDLKVGGADNELTKYRYDAVLSFDQPPAEETAEEAWSESSAGRATDPAVVARTVATTGRRVVVRERINPRVAGDVAAWRELRGASSNATAAAGPDPLDRDGIDPDAWREAGRQAGVAVAITWAASGHADRYDVHVAATPAELRFPPTPPERVDWRSLANHPLEEKRASALLPIIREKMAEKLPQYLWPAAMVLVDELPQTVNGKVDRAALPSPPAGRPAWATGYVEPEGEHEPIVARVWGELLGVSPVGAEDDFFVLGGHSMLAVRAAAEVERLTGKAPPLAAFFDRPTVRRVAASLTAPAEPSTLVPLTTTGDRAPLFCIHPAGGTVFCYRELAGRLGGDRPVFGVQAVGVDGRRSPHESVDEMVGCYTAAIESRTATGPVHLAGWSLGGNLSHAVANRLAERGRRVGVVALFDAAATPPEESLTEQDLGPLLQMLFPQLDQKPLEELRQLSPDQQVAYFAERAAVAGLIDQAELAASQHVFAVFQRNVQAVHRAKPTPFSGEVSLFRATRQQGDTPLEQDPRLGWGPLAGGVRVLPIDTSHTQMLHPPAVERLATLLMDELNRADANPADAAES